MSTPANLLTSQILAQVYKDGGYAFRVNSTGIYDPTTGKFRASAATKGVSDTLICYRGYLVCCEVKIAKDTQRLEQRAFESNVTHTGGIYFIAKSLEQFLLEWSKIKQRIDERELIRQPG